MLLMRPLFSKVGRNFVFDPDGYYSFSTIEVGDDVFLGPGAHISAHRVKVSIGDWVMFGPSVTILAGDHNTSVVGVPMRFVEAKRPMDDQDVVIESDVWIGANVTVLKGVRIGRGSIIGAGALVNRSIPPYSVAVGVPARVLRVRWSVAGILAHEIALYPQEQRMGQDAVESLGLSN